MSHEALCLFHQFCVCMMIADCEALRSPDKHAPSPFIPQLSLTPRLSLIPYLSIPTLHISLPYLTSPSVLPPILLLHYSSAFFYLFSLFPLTPSTLSSSSPFANFSLSSFSPFLRLIFSASVFVFNFPNLVHAFLRSFSPPSFLPHPLTLRPSCLIPFLSLLTWRMHP